MVVSISLSVASYVVTILANPATSSVRPGLEGGYVSVRITYG